MMVRLEILLPLSRNAWFRHILMKISNGFQKHKEYKMIVSGWNGHRDRGRPEPSQVFSFSLAIEIVMIMMIFMMIMMIFMIITFASQLPRWQWMLKSDELRRSERRAQRFQVNIYDHHGNVHDYHHHDHDYDNVQEREDRWHPGGFAGSHGTDSRAWRTSSSSSNGHR